MIRQRNPFRRLHEQLQEELQGLRCPGLRQMTPQRVDYVMGILMDHVSTPMGPLNAESLEEGAEACFRWLMDNPNLWVCADRFDWLSSENLEMAALLESMLDLSGFKFVKNGQRFKVVDPTKYVNVLPRLPELTSGWRTTP